MCDVGGFSSLLCGGLPVLVPLAWPGWVSVLSTKERGSGNHKAVTPPAVQSLDPLGGGVRLQLPSWASPGCVSATGCAGGKGVLLAWCCGQTGSSHGRQPESPSPAGAAPLLMGGRSGAARGPGRLCAAPRLESGQPSSNKGASPGRARRVFVGAGRRATCCQHQQACGRLCLAAQAGVLMQQPGQGAQTPAATASPRGEGLLQTQPLQGWAGGASGPSFPGGQREVVGNRGLWPGREAGPLPPPSRPLSCPLLTGNEAGA